ncbi:hypothetical protein, partial [Enterocloster citroniae]|uniref:hypothetical protein n=1 Tax=Enterocloster citroniae TaxID=358743 RepID=UPI00303A1AC4|nr:hypothetical protein [Enterocloster citroniae]
KLFSNRSNFCHKFQVYFNHKQAVRAFNIDSYISRWDWQRAFLTGSTYFIGIGMLKINGESVTMDRSMFDQRR